MSFSLSKTFYVLIIYATESQDEKSGLKPKAKLLNLKQGNIAGKEKLNKNYVTEQSFACIRALIFNILLRINPMKMTCRLLVC